MEKKKYLPVRIIHAILLLASLGLCVYALIKSPADTSKYGASWLSIVVTLLDLLMLTFGLAYLLMNYSKSAAIIYKVFFALLFTGAFVQTIFLATLPESEPAYIIVLNIIPVAVVSALAVAKDLGRTNTVILVTTFILCRLILMIVIFANLSDYGSGAVGAISNCVSNLLIAITTGLMVFGKYLDKAQRGTN